MKDCIFCKIAKGEVPAKFQGKTKNVVGFDSISPVSTHHILIVPKKHISTFLDIESKHKSLVLEMIELSKSLIKKNKIKGGYRLVINGGKYQSINHFHLHLLAGKLEEGDDVLNKT